MMGNTEAVNAQARPASAKKKPDSKESGLRYWPREADTITFQEGLLSVRVTGGGGQKRNPNAQHPIIMIRVDVLQQASPPHVSHAETAGSGTASIRTASAAPC